MSICSQCVHVYVHVMLSLMQSSRKAIVQRKGVNRTVRGSCARRRRYFFKEFQLSAIAKSRRLKVALGVHKFIQRLFQGGIKHELNVYCRLEGNAARDSEDISINQSIYLFILLVQKNISKITSENYSTQSYILKGTKWQPIREPGPAGQGHLYVMKMLPDSSQYTSHSFQ